MSTTKLMSKIPKLKSKPQGEPKQLPQAQQEEVTQIQPLSSQNSDDDTNFPNGQTNNMMTPPKTTLPPEVQKAMETLEKFKREMKPTQSSTTTMTTDFQNQLAKNKIKDLMKTVNHK